MTSYFRTAGVVAGRQANVGQGKLALAPDARIEAPLLRLACRESYGALAGEQQLLDHIIEVVTSAGFHFSRTLIVEYYVSLKTNPFVILSGPAGRGKTEFVQRFAEALIGRNSSQYALIPGVGAWQNGAGEEQFYRSLHERFCSWRFLELLQEAADPANSGKAYLVCFDALRPDELTYYFTNVLQVAPNGEKRLIIPGAPAEARPVVPSNVYITATVDAPDLGHQLSRDVLRHAGLITFRGPSAPGIIAHQPAETPPVGYQRVWLNAAVHNVNAARRRLLHLLDADQFSRLRCSPALARLLWRGGLVLTTQTLHDLTTYVANSFDAQGNGLFDLHDRQHNAQIAFDAQLIQRVLWRLHDTEDAALRHDLTDYLDRMAVAEWQQAVA